jgi:5-methylthioadenosine/S-adenosylhomocysteine deaminase
MTLFRGLADDLALMDWLNHHIWPAEEKWVNPEFVRDGTRHAIAEMLRSGTTCFNDMYFFPDHTAAVAAELGMRASVGLIVIDFPTAWAKDAQEYFAKAVQVHDEYRNHPLITTAFAPHAPYTVSDDALSRVGALAEEMDLNIHIHVHETAHEVDTALAQTGLRPLQRLQRLGLLSPRLLAVHMTALDASDIELAAAHNIHIAHCPHSNLKLTSGFCQVHRLQQTGLNVALGTDGAASNNSLDMLAEMRLAALLGKAVSGEPTALPATRALRMATLDGARALGLEEQIGSLLPGKQADLIAIDLGGICTQPLYDPVSQIVYSASRGLVSDVWVAGRHVLDDRTLTTVDEAQIRQTAAVWQQRIAATDAAG